MSRRLRYPLHATLGELTRAGLGMALAGTPLVAIEIPLPVALILGGLVLLFAVQGCRAAVDGLAPVDVDDDGVIVRGPFPREVRWDDLRRIRLAYYSTRHDGSAGWMQLTLTGRGRPIAVSSRLDGFAGLAARAASAAGGLGLALDGATSSNLAALGLPSTDDGPKVLP
jgi:hypothetical protein